MKGRRIKKSKGGGDGASRGDTQRESNDLERNGDHGRLVVLPASDRVIREFQLGPGRNNGLIFYVRKTDHAYKNRQGDLLGRLISLRDSHVNDVMMATDTTRLIEEECTTPALTDILIQHIGCVKSLLVRDIQLAFNRQIACTLHLTSLLQNANHLNEDWTLQLLYSVAVDTRILAGRAASTGSVDLDITNLDLAADALLGCFRLCSRVASCKRAGILPINKQLITIFFGMKQIGLSQPDLVDLAIHPINELFPFAPQRATFQNFAHADDFYEFAYEHCPRAYKPFKKMILIRLVPLKMAKGVMPNERLMQANNLSMFYDLGVAIETGNLFVFDRIVFENTLFFLKHGLYNFITQHLRYDTHRNAQEMNYNVDKENYIQVGLQQQAVQLAAIREANREAFRTYFTYYCTDGTFRRYYYFTNRVLFPQDGVLPNLN